MTKRITSILITANLALTSPASAGGFFGDAFDAFSKGVGDGLTAIGKGVGDGATAIGKGVGDGATAIGKGIDDGIVAVTKATSDTGHSIEIATHQVGDALEKAAQDTGRGVDQTGQWIGRHPWETVAAVALIAGGGYLIVAQHFVVILSVPGVSVATISTGAAGTVAVAAGGASGITLGTAAIAGAAVVVGNVRDPSYGAGGSTDTPVAGAGFPSQSVGPTMGTLTSNINGTITIATNAGRTYTTNMPMRLPSSAGVRAAFAPFVGNSTQATAQPAAKGNPASPNRQPREQETISIPMPR